MPKWTDLVTLTYYVLYCSGRTHILHIFCDNNSVYDIIVRIIVTKFNLLYDYELCQNIFMTIYTYIYTHIFGNLVIAGFDSLCLQ